MIITGYTTVFPQNAFSVMTGGWQCTTSSIPHKGICERAIYSLEIFRAHSIYWLAGRVCMTIA